MKFKKTAINLLFFLLVALCAGRVLASSPIEQPKIGDIHAYLFFSGVEDVLDSVTDSLEKSAEASDSGLDREGGRAGILRDAWERLDVKNLMAQIIQQKASRQQIRALLDWHQSPLARVVHAEEKRVNQADYDDALGEYKRELRKNPLSDKRMELIEEAIAATNMIDSNIEIVGQIVEGTVRGSIPAKEESLIDEDRINNIIRRRMKSLTENMIRETRDAAFFVFRDLSDKELIEYIEFHDSELGQFEVQLITEAYSEAFGKFGRVMGESLRKSD